MTERDTAEAVADDAIEGVEAIARFLGLAPRRTFYLLEQGLLPAGKLGTRWVASKKRLARHYTELAAGRAVGTKRRRGSDQRSRLHRTVDGAKN